LFVIVIPILCVSIADSLPPSMPYDSDEFADISSLIVCVTRSSSSSP